MKRLVLTTLMVLATTLAFAQEGEVSKNLKPRSRESFMSIGFETRAGGALGKQYREFNLLDVEANFGYHFNDRWSLHIPFTASTGLFYGSMNFAEQLYLGLSAEYKAYQDNKISVVIVPKVQSTLGNKWGAMAYDLGVKLEWLGNPYITVGLRYIDTYKSPDPLLPMSDKLCLYISLGIRFNSPKYYKLDN